MIGFERHERSIYLSFPCNISLARQIASLFAAWLSGRKPAMAMNAGVPSRFLASQIFQLTSGAETASIARDIGVRKAAEQAFSTVLNRILLTNDARLKFMTLHDLDDFSDFVHIVEENNLDRRYIATLDFVLTLQGLGKP